PGNTFDAHRLLAWAATVGQEPQDRLKERLFLAYMTEGKLVWDHDTLVELAGEVGLDGDQARAILASDGYADEVRAEETLAGELAVTGVPFFVVDRRIALQGAQPPELLRKALDKAVEMRSKEAEAPARAEAGDGCGPDGCAI
ncbi:MAG: DsbA family oxidoreductase, partial [Deltaproteobacteria bacterium]|nr:DsbA family oxidoreductase [Deltaproteobacteria bacterium]